MAKKPVQLPIEYEVVSTKEVNGLEMGVLKNGTAFLTGRGLAKVCGVAHPAILKWSVKLAQEGGNLGGSKIGEMLMAQGFLGGNLYIPTHHEGQPVHAYPDSVCMAFIEYYSFEAGPNRTAEALTNYRALARHSLREFIYQNLGYNPTEIVPEPWRHFHDRMLLNDVPFGYFSVFKEAADIVVSAIRNGLSVDHHTVPDISVGLAWAKHWKANGLAAKFGDRIKHRHVYPDYFPQAQNGAIDANVYPLAALGEFRRWLQAEYLTNKFPAYLRSKAAEGAILAIQAEMLIKAVDPSKRLS